MQRFVFKPDHSINLYPRLVLYFGAIIEGEGTDKRDHRDGGTGGYSSWRSHLGISRSSRRCRQIILINRNNRPRQKLSPKNSPMPSWTLSSDTRRTIVRLHNCHEMHGSLDFNRLKAYYGFAGSQRSVVRGWSTVVRNAVFNVSTEMAKFRFWPSLVVEVAMPITCPDSSRTGEPLEPGENAAVI